MPSLRERFVQAVRSEVYLMPQASSVRIDRTTPESPWYGEVCAFEKCPEKTLRAGDRVICCPNPRCKKVFHQDPYHQLLCWSLHYCGSEAGCPGPGCSYHFYKEQIILKMLEQHCEEKDCSQTASYVIPLGEETLVYHQLCDVHRQKYLWRFYQQELLHILRGSQTGKGECGGECRAKSVTYWTHESPIALVPFSDGEVSLCATCREILKFSDPRSYLREQFYRGFFLGAYPKNNTLGEIPLRYYRDLEKTPNRAKGNQCIYCHTGLRPNDRVAACPGCGCAYHEDIFSQLLCWTSHFSSGRREGRCASPLCRYRIEVRGK